MHGEKPWRSCTVGGSSTGYENVAINHGEQSGVPAGTTVGVDIRGEVGLHGGCHCVRGANTGGEDAHIVPAVAEARYLSDVVATDDEDGLIDESNVARAERAVHHGEVAVVVCVQIEDSSNEGLHGEELSVSAGSAMKDLAQPMPFSARLP